MRRRTQRRRRTRRGGYWGKTLVKYGREKASKMAQSAKRLIYRKKEPLPLSVETPFTMKHTPSNLTKSDAGLLEKIKQMQSELDALEHEFLIMNDVNTTDNRKPYVIENNLNSLDAQIDYKKRHLNELKMKYHIYDQPVYIDDGFTTI